LAVPTPPGQKKAAAEIAGKTDPDKGGHQPCRSTGDPQIVPFWAKDASIGPRYCSNAMSEIVTYNLPINS
jgi:hypothetical protein